MKLEKFLNSTQKQLFKMLCKHFEGRSIFCKGAFILVQGDAPIMLVAHLDTVHAESVKTICKSDDGNILMSPEGIGGDDRCGVYALVNVYEKSEVKPYLLFTCDEEVGGVGAEEFAFMYEENKLPALDNLKCLVEIDRRGSRDAVYYDCANKDFEKYITGKGFITAHGSFSDISVIAPALGIAAVNLSSGYYNAHTLHEYINRAEIDSIIEKVIEIVADSVRDDFSRFEYIKNTIAFRLDKFGESDAEELKKMELLADLPKEYEDYYQDFLECYTAKEIADTKEFFGKHWAEILYQDLITVFSSGIDDEE